MLPVHYTGEMKAERPQRLRLRSYTSLYKPSGLTTRTRGASETHPGLNVCTTSLPCSINITLNSAKSSSNSLQVISERFRNLLSLALDAKREEKVSDVRTNRARARSRSNNLAM